jgi:hypothetical protein
VESCILIDDCSRLMGSAGGMVSEFRCWWKAAAEGNPNVKHSKETQRWTRKTRKDRPGGVQESVLRVDIWLRKWDEQEMGITKIMAVMKGGRVQGYIRREAARQNGWLGERPPTRGRRYRRQPAGRPRLAGTRRVPPYVLSRLSWGIEGLEGTGGRQPPASLWSRRSIWHLAVCNLTGGTWRSASPCPCLQDPCNSSWAVHVLIFAAIQCLPTHTPAVEGCVPRDMSNRPLGRLFLSVAGRLN